MMLAGICDGYARQNLNDNKLTEHAISTVSQGGIGYLPALLAKFAHKRVGPRGIIPCDEITDAFEISHRQRSKANPHRGRTYEPISVLYFVSRRSKT